MSFTVSLGLENVMCVPMRNILDQRNLYHSNVEISMNDSRFVSLQSLKLSGFEGRKPDMLSLCSVRSTLVYLQTINQILNVPLYR